MYTKLSPHIVGIKTTFPLWLKYVVQRRLPKWFEWRQLCFFRRIFRALWAFEIVEPRDEISSFFYSDVQGHLCNPQRNSAASLCRAWIIKWGCSLMSSNNTPVYSLLGLPLLKYISHIPKAPFNTEKCKEQERFFFFLPLQLQQIHNDPLRATWDFEGRR